MDTTKNKVRLFEQQQVRAVWDEKNEKWWFSVPSKKAEPFKQWLARVGSERIDESLDPEL
ncbi:MAG: hypothetical protein LBR84_06345 [Tannerella sp.]|nr:hypothetical protein [Tannerella sp.]